MIHGHWLSNTGWSISPAGKNKGIQRWVLKGPNGRRWETFGQRRSVLRKLADRLAKLGVASVDSPLNAKLPPRVLPKDVTEIMQRRCRGCHVTKVHTDFDEVRTCRVCVRSNCRGTQNTVDPCPACLEPCQTTRLKMVAGLGWACELCVAEHSKESASVGNVEDVVARARAAYERPLVAPSRSQVERPLRRPDLSEFERFANVQHVMSAGF